VELAWGPVPLEKPLKIRKPASLALLDGALLTAGSLAHAGLQADISVSGGSDGSAAPGSTAFTSFTISALGDYPFTGAKMTMDYNPALLSFNASQSSVAVLGTTYALPSFLTQLSTLSAVPGFNNFTIDGGASGPGSLYFSAGFTPSGSITLNGEIVVTTAFDLAPSMGIGSSADVTIAKLDFADPNTGPVSLATAEFPLVMTVTAVPEPESWLMLLAGAGLLGAAVRRPQGVTAENPYPGCPALPA